MHNTDYYRIVFQVILIGVSLLTLFHIVNTKENSKPPESNFTVIDQYKGCDVVQWHYSSFAEYKYFLHCK
jgi:hypothetical protein